MIYLQRVHGATLSDKVCSCEIRKALSHGHFSEQRDSNYVGSAMWSEWPTKDYQGEFSILHPRESGPEVAQVPDAMMVTARALLVSS